MAVFQCPSIGRRWLSAVGVTAVAIAITVAGSGAAHADRPVAQALAPAAVPVGGTYVALTPRRIMDTRSQLGGHDRLSAGQAIDLQVAGRGGVPGAGVGAVVVQVTSTQQSSPGFVTVYPALTSRPSASNLNFTSGQTTSNLVTVALGSNGGINLYNGSAGTNQLIVDVQGFYRNGATAGAGSFHSLVPARILDTRVHNGASGPIPAAGTLTVQVSGRGGVPTSGVSAVVINATAVSPAAGGFLTVYPAGGTRPSTSSLNFTAGQTTPNLVVVAINSTGKINVYNGSAGTTQVLADVQGYFLAGTPTAGGSFKALTPIRILDTRSGLGGSHRVAAGTETKLHVEGFGGVPASGVSAVVLNLTGVAPASAGTLVSYPTGVLQPLASNLNFTPRVDRANLVIVPVDLFGWVSISNNSGGPIDELADVAGYYLGTGITPNVLGSYTYGPFTIGMTIAQAKVVYPALNPTFFNSTSCGEVSLPQVQMVFNHGTTQLSYITPLTDFQTANGIHLGDTLGSVVRRFPWATIIPNEPQMIMGVTTAETTKLVPTTYWFGATGPRDVNDVPLPTDTITRISLQKDERCFN